MRNATTNALSPGYGLPAASPSRSKIAIIPSLSDYPKSHAANYTRPVSVTPETVNLESLKVRFIRPGTKPIADSNTERMEEDSPTAASKIRTKKRSLDRRPLRLRDLPVS